MHYLLVLILSIFLAACGPSSGGGGLETEPFSEGEDDTTPTSPSNPTDPDNSTDDSSAATPSNPSSPSANTTPVPELSAQTFSDLTFSTTVSGNISYTDEDSAAEEMVVTVEVAPTHGSVVITDHSTGAFDYQPSTVSGINGDTFDVSVSDGTNISTTQTMTLSFSDSTAPSLSLTPNNSANNVAVNSTLSVASDDPIDMTSVTYNGADGVCTGTIQVSVDSFTNCLAIQSIVASNLNRTLTVTLDSDMTGSTNYELKVTTGIKNLFTLAIGSDLTHSFTTARTELQITEIGAAYYSNVMRWFEVYNPSSNSVDLSNYSFKSKYLDTSGPAVHTAHTFALPSVSVSPGQYIVLRAQSQSETYASNSRVVHIKDGTFYPYWTNTGYIDLINNGSGKTVDFVTFGSSYTPTTGSEWSGTFVSGMPSDANSYGKGMGRDASLSDADLASDWTVRDWTTAGGANDITCNTDADSDGIPDCSEVEGSTFAGLPLYDWGARTGQRDIFIEVDYMDATDGGAQSADEGIIPQRAALQKVVDVFAAQGIALHFDVGNLYDVAVGLDPADFDLGGGEEVPYSDGVSFDPADSRANLYDYKRDYMDYSRIQIFHYLLFANSQNLDGSAGSSGLAELNANDLIVSLGNWGLNNVDATNTNRLVNYQASTLMHELGHNLGLQHGGHEGMNFKPNYISIMNYLYQLNGLPTIGSDEGDRVYFSSNFHNRNGNCYSQLSNGPTTETFIMDYSHGNASNINFSAVDETKGLGQSGSNNVDFDCDGDDTEVSVTLPDNNGELSGSLADYDDWSNLNLVFQRSFSGHNHGEHNRSLDEQIDDVEDVVLMPERVYDDRAQIVKEYTPPAEFFQNIPRRP